MAGFSARESCNKVALEYKFEFSGSKFIDGADDKVVLSDRYFHRGDVWQLETKNWWLEGGYPGDSVHLMDCTLHLIRSESYPVNHKVARICFFADSQLIDSSQIASFLPSGGKCVMDSFSLSLTSKAKDVKIVVEVLRNLEVIDTPTQPPLSHMSYVVLNWFQSEDFGDVTIVAADGMKFHCQKEFLARRSEVFGRMFSSPMKEARENVVSIEDFDGKIVTQLLLYIYTDECNFDEYRERGPAGTANRLYAAAHQYQLDGLKFRCESVMTVNLSPQSIVKTFRLAKFYDLKQLMAECVDYLDTHKAELSIADLLAEALKIQEGNEGEVSQDGQE